MKKTACLLISLFALTLHASAQRPEIFRQVMHTAPVMAVAYSPDGKYVASGSEDKTVKIWDVNTGYQVDVIKLDKFVRKLEFTPDGKKLLIGVSKTMLLMGVPLVGPGEVIVMDFERRTELKRIPYANWPLDLCCSSDSKYAFVAYSKGYDIIDLETYTSLTDLPATHYSDRIAISPDMRLMAICGRPGDANTFTGVAADFLVFKLDGMDDIEEVHSDNFTIVTSVAFSPDSKLLAYGTLKGNIYVIDTEDFEALPGFNLALEDRHQSSVRKLKFTGDGKYLISSSGDEKIKVWDASTGKLVNTFEGHKKPITDFALSPSSDFVVSSALENDFKLWDVNSCTPADGFNFQSPIVYAIDISPDAKCFITASDDKNLRLYDFRNGNLLKIFRGHTLITKFVLFSPDGKYILSAASDEVGSESVSEAIVWDAVSGKLLKKLRCEGAVHSICFSPDSKQCIVSDYKPMIYDIKHDETIGLWEKTGYSASLADIAWLNDGKAVLVANSDSRPERRLSIQSLVKRDTWQFLTGGESGSFAVSRVSPDGRYFAARTHSNRIYIWDISTKALIQTLDEGRASVFTFSHDSKYLATTGYSGIAIWDIAAQKKIRTIPARFGYINATQFTPDDKFLLLGAEDGTVRKVNLANDEWIAMIGDGTGSQWIIYNNDGYWDASTQVGNFITMKQGSQIFSVDQLAVWTNRPDKIYEKFGEASPSLVAHYKQQYMKRLRKLGLKESDASNQFEIPKVKITESVQNKKMLDLTIDMSENTVKIARYNIFINDIPLFGASGKIFAETPVVKERVELTEGKNKIEVSCTNANGVESYRALTFATYAEPVPKDLYLLAFGVSEYQNSSYNLRYAAKDAADLSKLVESYQGKGFDHVYTKILTDRQVTPDSIRAAKEFVRNAKVDDTFILFIAGHGMHDRDAEATYYFLTSNADVDNLKATAANFETIEDLLQGIPPRNKLFLMDACESGELDEEDQGQMIAAAGDAGMKSRGFKTIAKSQAAGSHSTSRRSYLYQKDRYIYNDLVRRSGAIVFSSSKGGELSYERTDIENGLFTESIMKALTSKDADKNADGVVSTDELREYVSAEVAKSSGDLQHPTVDRDNIYQKFGFKVN